MSRRTKRERQRQAANRAIAAQAANLPKKKNRKESKRICGDLVLERCAIAINDRMWPPHYIEASSKNTTLCGKQVPPVPEEFSLTGIGTGLKLDHQYVCKTCRRIVDNSLNNGHSVRLANRTETRFEEPEPREVILVDDTYAEKDDDEYYDIPGVDYCV